MGDGISRNGRGEGGGGPYLLLLRVYAPPTVRYVIWAQCVSYKEGCLYMYIYALLPVGIKIRHTYAVCVQYLILHKSGSVDYLPCDSERATCFVGRQGRVSAVTARSSRGRRHELL